MNGYQRAPINPSETTDTIKGNGGWRRFYHRAQSLMRLPVKGPDGAVTLGRWLDVDEMAQAVVTDTAYRLALQDLRHDLRLWCKHQPKDAAAVQSEAGLSANQRMARRLLDVLTSDEVTSNGKDGGVFTTAAAIRARNKAAKRSNG